MKCLPRLHTRILIFKSKQKVKEKKIDTETKQKTILKFAITCLAKNIYNSTTLMWNVWSFRKFFCASHKMSTAVAPLGGTLWKVFIFQVNKSTMQKCYESKSPHCKRIKNLPTSSGLCLWMTLARSKFPAITATCKPKKITIK